MGFFTPRIKTKELAQLTRRMGISLEAGVDLRKTLDRESTNSGRAVLLNQIQRIKEKVDAGGSVTAAVREVGEFFPLLFRELVRVGEETGHLPAVLCQVADHYDMMLRQRRKFRSALFAPLVQLFLAICAIGFLIWIAAIVNVDILNLGLTGTTGLVIWFGIVGAITVGIVLVVRGFYLDLPWTRPVKRLFMRLPVINQAVTLISMTRLTWAMGLTFNSGMDVRHAIRLGLRASLHPDHLAQEDKVDGLIDEGFGVYETFAQMGCFDAVFLDHLRTGEETGMIAETMTRLSRPYQERALLAISALSVIAFWIVWGLIAAFMIFMILGGFGTYLNAIGG